MDMSDEEIEEVYRLDLERQNEPLKLEPSLIGTLLTQAWFWALFVGVMYAFWYEAGQ